MTATLLTERHVAPKLLVDELAARATLRRQIARLEQRLADSTTELWHARALEPAAPGDNRGREPRLLMLAELEATRDALVDQVRAAEQRIHEFAESQVRARARLEAMLAEPGAHRYGVVRLAELGQPGCGAYQVRPRLGLLGMLFGWWCIKLSSGCP